MPREWRADWNGHQIVLTNSIETTISAREMGSVAKLYIDGAMVDSSAELFAGGATPLVRGQIKDGDGTAHVVEGYLKSGLLRVLGKICVDGIKVAGDSKM